MYRVNVSIFTPIINAERNIENKLEIINNDRQNLTEKNLSRLGWISNIILKNNLKQSEFT